MSEFTCSFEIIHVIIHHLLPFLFPPHLVTSDYGMVAVTTGVGASERMISERKARTLCSVRHSPELVPVAPTARASGHSVCLSVCQPACLRVRQPACLSLPLPVCLCLLMFQPVDPSVTAPLLLSLTRRLGPDPTDRAHLSVCLSVCPPVCPSVCLSAGMCQQQQQREAAARRELQNNVLKEEEKRGAERRRERGGGHPLPLLKGQQPSHRNHSVSNTSVSKPNTSHYKRSETVKNALFF